jgi:hypothetical protein
MKEARQFPRVKINIKVAYEFVKWNEYKLEKMEKPFYANSIDISSRGVRLDRMPELKTGIKKQLETGKKKIKVELFINPETPPLIAFARLIWTNLDESNNDSENIVCGLMFIDVSTEFFLVLENFVNKLI